MRRDVFQAIADPTRREIIDLLANKSLNLNAIADNFTISRPAVSKQIKILTQCGLVTITRQGREHYCAANLKKFSEVAVWIEKYKLFWNTKLDALGDFLEKEAGSANQKPPLKQVKMKNEPIVVERVYNAPVKAVWEAITDLNKMKQWYFPTLTEFEPAAGFETRFDVEQNEKVFVHIWKITEVEHYKKISYEWKFGGYPGNSVVSFELLPEGDHTKIVLTHKGVETFSGDLHPELAVQNFIKGWTWFIGTRLKEFIEEQTEE